jgi:DNA (cytosine-5)-methyltransferase 1
VTAKQAGGPAGSASETDNCIIQKGAVSQIAPTLSTKNEVASSSTQREKWQEQSAELFGAVRRLTPVECCRLQGFPDDWNDDQTDSQRYRQMGNAVCVPVAEWIGRRIAEAIK